MQCEPLSWLRVWLFQRFCWPVRQCWPWALQSQINLRLSSAQWQWYIDNDSVFICNECWDWDVRVMMFFKLVYDTWLSRFSTADEVKVIERGGNWGRSWVKLLWRRENNSHRMIDFNQIWLRYSFSSADKVKVKLKESKSVSLMYLT